MKIRSIVFLLALCLTLSVVSVQAQTDTAKKMDNVNVIVTGDIDETVTCDMTGNVAVIGSKDNMTGNQTGMDGQTDNMTGMEGNMAEPKTCSVTGKVLVIKDMANMTANAIMVGKMDNMPGKVIMFGKVEKEEMEKMAMAEKMDNMTQKMEKLENITVLMAGNVTGTMTCNMTEDMTGNQTESMTQGNMTGMQGKMDNMTVLMKGNMTGTVTADLTKKMIIIENIGDMAGMIERICNLTEMDGNMSTMSGMADNMSNMTGVARDMSTMDESMECNMTGNMIIFKDVATMTWVDGKIDNMAQNDQEMDAINGKIITISKPDNMTQVMAKNVTCDIDESTVMVKNLNDMTGMEGKVGEYNREYGQNY